MVTKGSGYLLAAGVLGSLMIGAAPALAQSHGGGGAHASGGGHFGGGGGHSGGGRAAPAGHFAGGASHYAPAGHFAAGTAYNRGYSPAVRGAAYAGRGAYAHPGGYYGHSGGYYGHGYSTGAYWRGGYWHGGFWPRCYYGLGFSWFLPILPLAYATYWYSGIPYYYANDVYYTYNPSYEGYVATDPPPAVDSGTPEGAGPNAAPPPGDVGALPGQIFMYPKAGQSAEQQASDKSECQRWAAEQAGDVAQNGSDYQRAMTACVEGRGYSAR